MQKHTFLCLIVWTMTKLVLIRAFQLEVCSPEQQRDILSSPQHPCELRQVIVDLKHHISNMTDVVSMLPDMVQVVRCGGNCFLPSLRCVPTTRRMKQIPVMFIMTSIVNNINDQSCGTVSVEEHESCECGCPMTVEDCLVNGVEIRDKVFDPDHCKCRCLNVQDRVACNLAGREWNEHNCRCMCPSSSWHHCSSGYTFDHEQTCRCVPVNLTASTGLIAALVVLVMGVLVTTVGFYTMYQKQTGLFKHLRVEERIHIESQRLSLAKSQLDDDTTNEAEIISEISKLKKTSNML